MRRRHSLSIVSLLSIAALIGACTDRPGTTAGPTGPETMDSRGRHHHRGRDRDSGRCVDFDVKMNSS